MTNVNIDISVYGASQAYLQTEVMKLFNTVQNYVAKEQLYYYNAEMFNDFISKHLDGTKQLQFCNQVQFCNHYTGTRHFIESKKLFLLTVNNDEETMSFSYAGNERFCAEIFTVIESYFEPYKNTKLNWVYRGSNGMLDFKALSFKNNYKVCDEMYPFLDTGIQEYYKSYMASNSPILVLIGNPGTGKTSFLKGLFEHSKKNAYFTFDNTILNDDKFFIDFITGSSDLLIIEDCDQAIQKREDGNTIMSKLLNVSDGFVNMNGKKIIFTTNLPSINSVDEALLRKGRCYDTLNFRNLNKQEAEKLAGKFGLVLPDAADYSIADIFNTRENHTPEVIATNKMGFIR